MLVQPLSSRLGAVISDLDLRDLDATTARQLRDEVVANKVVFVRGQHLTDDEHLTMARWFGTPSVYPLARLMGADRALGYIRDSAESPPDADVWHTDLTWIAEPPTFAFLNAIEIPERGGDTMWSDLEAAYTALSEPVQELLARCEVEHLVSEPIVRNARQMGLDERLSAEYPPQRWPLVRTHPVTGRPLLFACEGFATRVLGVSAAESRWILDFVHRHIGNENLTCRWSWTPGDMAIWDERSTNHRALSDHYPASRTMRRCTVDGDTLA